MNTFCLDRAVLEIENGKPKETLNSHLKERWIKIICLTIIIDYKYY